MTRVDDDLMAAAKLLGGTMHRSAAQQLSHWARIGLELERGPEVAHAEIVEVLSGRRDYDELSDKEQAIVRAEWTERLAARIADLDLRATWAERGHGYVGLDDAGNVVHYDADGTVADAHPTRARRRPAASTTAAASVRTRVATKPASPAKRAAATTTTTGTTRAAKGSGKRTAAAAKARSPKAAGTAKRAKR